MSLLGVTPEEIFAFLYGPSNTGKSKFVECLRLRHGSYGTGAPTETFSVSKGERHPTDLAGFVGRRLVTAAGTEEGRRWDQQRLTTLTGRERIQARFMRGDFFEYVPQFLLRFPRQLSSQTIWRVGRAASSFALAVISAQAGQSR